MTIHHWKAVTAAGVIAMLTACGGYSDSAQEDGETAGERAIRASSAAPDTTGAAMWAYLADVDYASNWQRWPGTETMYAGNEPHGMLLTTYVNDVAMGAINTSAGSMPPGAIVVKQNYMQDSTLAAVTVMYKVSGYNAEHSDWFFTKHLPSGELDTMPNGMAMEGRLPGCQNCHMGQRANDYLFTAVLTGQQ